MADKEITERFLKRRIRRYLRLGNLLIMKYRIDNSEFYVKRNFPYFESPVDPVPFLQSDFSLQIYEPFMLLRIKVIVKNEEILIGFEFLQNDSIGWIIFRTDRTKSDINSFIKDLRKFKQWKI